MRSQKQTILNIIRETPGHLTAEQIYLIARREHPSMAMGTVYRNLALLAEEGEIGRVEIPGKSVRFDKSSRPHGHMICLSCGAAEDLEMGEELLDFLRQRTKRDIRAYQLTVQCLCPECATRGEAPPS